jgi:hypothetical protein
MCFESTTNLMAYLHAWQKLFFHCEVAVAISQEHFVISSVRHRTDRSVQFTVARDEILYTENRNFHFRFFFFIVFIPKYTSCVTCLPDCHFDDIFDYFAELCVGDVRMCSRAVLPWHVTLEPEPHWQQKQTSGMKWSHHRGFWCSQLIWLFSRM